MYEKSTRHFLQHDIGPTIIIAGSLRYGKHLVTMDGKELLLTHARFELLLHLVICRAKHESGLTPLPATNAEKRRLHQEIRRLRLDLESIGIDGKEFVIHGRSSCYFLADCCIIIQSSLKELVPNHVSEALVNELFKFFDAKEN